jgi:hypothetical protein
MSKARWPRWPRGSACTASARRRRWSWRWPHCTGRVRAAEWSQGVVLIALVFAVPHLVPALHADVQGDKGAAASLDVALLQGNIPQDEKFIPGGGIETALRWYGEQLRDAKASLVVTPETALPLLPQQLPAGYLEAIQARYSQGTQAAIVGLPMTGGGRARTATQCSASSPAPRSLQLQQAPPGALRRIHSHGLSLVHPDDEHPARRLRARRPRAGAVPLAGPAHCAQHLLRGLVRRRDRRQLQATRPRLPPSCST